MLTNKELIKKAASVIEPKEVKGGLIGNVGCALIAKSGKFFLGVCTGLGWAHGVCAEQAAISSMIANGEYAIEKIVAVWKDETEAVFVIPPCGNCRQYMKEIDVSNIQNTEIILDENKTVKLSELLPYYDWWQKQEGSHGKSIR
ncbi:cytidine deaminase [Patescibacteria group bacterium]|nr:cytidine deaminase [Patescibacteria group bacterium]MBU1612804.1 cytidine deaminase [Patescibacteria group bacterium]